MPLTITLAQLNLTVGDFDANVERLVVAANGARAAGSHLLVTPELALTGYPPEDLLDRPGFIRQSDEALLALAGRVAGIDVVVGHPRRFEGRLYNAASLIRDGRIVATYHKRQLPNYSVFDEKRHFDAGDTPCVFEVHGVPVGLSICEDVWHPGVVGDAVAAGASLVLNLNASPFHTGKRVERETKLRHRLAEGAVPIVYVNLVGGQDELIFDGGSFVMDRDGRIAVRAPAFVESLCHVAFDIAGGRPVTISGPLAEPGSATAEVYQALVLGVRDYVRKNRFQGALLGLSGGIDSALTLAIACDALGPEQVEAVLMPSRYTARISIDDAVEQAQTLGATHRLISIEPAFRAFLELLEPAFAGLQPDATEENIQARCRGVIMMALSNKSGRILLTTGNKSELAVGYATLYGDMAGGFAPLKDVPKMLVYRLAEYRNGLSEVIPRRVIERPPSAELAPDQQDSDTLPPYPVLDEILLRYVEGDACAEEIVADGYDTEVVARVLRLVDRNEYKRRQAPPGVRISRRAFGRDRRYPITSGFRSR